MIVLDTSALFASLNRNDANHSRAAHVIRGAEGPLVVPALILAEVGYLVEQRLGQHALAAFLDDVLQQAYLVDCQEPDFVRIRQLIQRYADLPLGFADASVIACAERRKGPVLTFDFRHFLVVARERTFEMLDPTQ